MKHSTLSSSPNSGNTIVSRSQFKPMLFSSPMVRAILDDRKKITRRQKGLTQIDLKATEVIPNTGWPKQGNFTARFQFKNIKNDGVDAWEVTNILKSPLKIGDIIWVRETFRSVEQDYGQPRYEYKATENINTKDKWKPSLFMPKKACRLFLEVTDLRVEKLQDISWEDAVNEGCSGYRPTQYEPTDEFKDLWNKINKNWNDNPWVWVITFKRLERPQGFC
jgi:ribosomal protein S28E/S33